MFYQTDFTLYPSKRFDDDSVKTNLNDDNKIKNYFLFDCKDSICKQTSGYIKSGDNTVAFVGTDHAINTVSNSVFVGSGSIDPGNCGSNAGKIVSGNGSICYSSDSNIIEFDTDNHRYIYLNGKAISGTPFADSDYSVVVKRNAKYIVRDRFYTERNIIYILINFIIFIIIKKYNIVIKMFKILTIILKFITTIINSWLG